MTSDAAIVPRRDRKALPSRIWLLAPVALIVAAVAIAVMIPRAEAVPALSGGTVLPGGPAPDFRLTDQFGRSIRLSQLRGHPVLITFLAASCKELCPVVAGTIHRSLADLGADGKHISVLAISTDPEGDTHAIVRRFSRQHGLYHRWLYLNAARSTLSQVWRRYYIYAAPASAPAAVRDAHTSATYLIDSTGHERLLMTGNPGTPDLVRDLRILSGLPVTSVSSIPAPEAGHPAPSLLLPSLNSGSVNLSSYRGQVVLLNFWATWCKPCRSEMPKLASWYRRFHGSGLAVVGVDQQDSASDARSFIQRLKIPYRILLDESGDTSATFNVIALPTSFLIDRHGIVRALKIEDVDHQFLTHHVMPLLQAKPAA